MEKVNKEENQSNIAQFIGNNNTIEQNNYNNQVTIDSDFLLEMTKKQHKLYPYFSTGIDKLPNGKIGYKSIPTSKEAEKKFPLSIQSNVTIIDDKYKKYTDFNKALKTMEFTLRHEIGHIIVKNKFVGKPMKEWDKVDYEESIGYNGMPTLRKNASKQARLEWLLQYNSLPSEKAANDAVGITEEDIIEDFNRLS